MAIRLFIWLWKNGAEVRALNDTVKPKENLDNYLVVINGVVQEKRGMKDIDSAFFDKSMPIEIRIYKSQAAIDKYGEKGKDGVIEIKTQENYAKVTDTIPKVDTIYGLKEMPIPKRMSPTAGDLKSWEDAKMYGVWIDANRISNSDLKNHFYSVISIH